MHAARMNRATLSQPQAPVEVPQTSPKPPAPHGPTIAQAAAYIHDMTSTMRNLAAQHKLTTLALLLEMAAVEAGSIRGNQP